MKRENEMLDIKSLERELMTQSYRYQLALKDGAVDSIVAEVIRRISFLEERIQQLKPDHKSVIYFRFSR